MFEFVSDGTGLWLTKVMVLIKIKQNERFWGKQYILVFPCVLHREALYEKFKNESRYGHWKLWILFMQVSFAIVNL